MAKRKADAEASSNGTASKKRALSGDNIVSNFREGLFDTGTLAEYVRSYATSEPYKHGVIRGLIDDDLLRSVRSEIIQEINFTPKETDIYKIHQSGDLANLDGLDDASLKKLPSLLKLRDSLYSKEFREWISLVGNSGPLSGKKTDMAINVYTPGCHLLCHDDVIGSRRLSYILYLTDPDKPWQAKWGGSLRLYPTTTMTSKDGKTKSIVPSSKFSVVIPPSWNQLSFFTIQPGLSFHDVGEVYHRKEGEPGDEVDGGRVRMAISGWFHIPQEGEDGYEEGLEEKQAEKSSLNQLQQKEADQFDLPQPQWKDIADDEDEWTEDQLQIMAHVINPIYLVPDTLEELAENFAEDSVVTLKDFLHPKEAAKIKAYLLAEDKKKPGFDMCPNIHGGDGQVAGIARPPHKHRFVYRNPSLCIDTEIAPPEVLLDTTITSRLFIRWLRLLTNLKFSRASAMLRRFRTGQDYTLATGYDAEEPQLEICLGLTPTEGWGGADDDDDEDEGDEQGDEDGIPPATKSNGKTKDSSSSNTVDVQDTEEPQVGGYEVYMAADEEDDLESVGDDDEQHDSTTTTTNTNGQGSSHTGAGNRGNSKKTKKQKADPAVYKAAAEDDEGADDGVLFSMPASWNTLSVVLRDKGILKFVKYVSRSAPGDRWDITGMYTVKPDEDDDDQDDDE